MLNDHKESVQGKPIPGRPVCGATESKTDPLDYMLMLSLNIIADPLNAVIDTESDSMEDMIATMENANKEILDNETKNVVLISTNVKALYPSLKAQPSQVPTLSKKWW